MKKSISWFGWLLAFTCLSFSNLAITDDYNSSWSQCEVPSDCTVVLDPCKNPIYINKNYSEKYQEWSEATLWHCICSSFSTHLNKNTEDEENMKAENETDIDHEILNLCHLTNYISLAYKIVLIA